jgi:hypothetical protein
VGIFHKRQASSDPYCVVTWNGEHVGKTDVVKADLNPWWGQQFSIPFPRDPALLGSQLLLEVFDHDSLSFDDYLGGVLLSGQELVGMHRPFTKQAFQLEDHPEKCAHNNGEPCAHLYDAKHGQSKRSDHEQTKAERRVHAKKLPQGGLTLVLEVPECERGHAFCLDSMHGSVPSFCNLSERERAEMRKHSVFVQVSI